MCPAAALYIVYEVKKSTAHFNMAILLITVLLCLRLNAASTSQPELSFTATTDVTFTCRPTMSGFQRNFAVLLDLQIVQLNNTQTRSDVILATVDKTDFWASRHLKNVHPWHTVSGQLYSGHRHFESWLRLTVHDIDSLGYGTYACQVVYMDHVADDEHSIWRKELHLAESDCKKKEAPGFMADCSVGVHVTCSHNTVPHGVDDISAMHIVSEDTKSKVSWWKTDNKTECTSNFLGPYYKVRASEVALHAHMPDVTCVNQSDYVCIVRTIFSENMTSTPKTLHFENCQVTRTADPGDSVLKNNNSTDIPSNSDSSSSAVSHFAVLGLSVGVMILVIIVAYAVFCRRRSSKLKAKKRGHYFQNLREIFRGGITKKGSSYKEDIENHKNELKETTSKEKSEKNIKQEDQTPFLCGRNSDSSSSLGSESSQHSPVSLKCSSLKEKMDVCNMEEGDSSSIKSNPYKSLDMEDKVLDMKINHRYHSKEDDYDVCNRPFDCQLSVESVPFDLHRTDSVLGIPVQATDDGGQAVMVM